jgi:hypothetical protein
MKHWSAARGVELKNAMIVAMPDWPAVCVSHPSGNAMRF